MRDDRSENLSTRSTSRHTSLRLVTAELVIQSMLCAYLAVSGQRLIGLQPSTAVDLWRPALHSNKERERVSGGVSTEQHTALRAFLVGCQSTGFLVREYDNYNLMLLFSVSRVLEVSAYAILFEKKSGIVVDFTALGLLRVVKSSSQVSTTSADIDTNKMDEDCSAEINSIKDSLHIETSELHALVRRTQEWAEAAYVHALLSSNKSLSFSDVTVSVQEASSSHSRLYRIESTKMPANYILMLVRGFSVVFWVQCNHDGQTLIPDYSSSQYYISNIGSSIFGASTGQRDRSTYTDGINDICDKLLACYSHFSWELYTKMDTSSELGQPKCILRLVPNQTSAENSSSALILPLYLALDVFTRLLVVTPRISNIAHTTAPIPLPSPVKASGMVQSVSHGSFSGSFGSFVVSIASHGPFIYIEYGLLTHDQGPTAFSKREFHQAQLLPSEQTVAGYSSIFNTRLKCGFMHCQGDNSFLSLDLDRLTDCMTKLTPSNSREVDDIESRFKEIRNYTMLCDSMYTSSVSRHISTDFFEQLIDFCLQKFNLTVGQHIVGVSHLLFTAMSAALPLSETACYLYSAFGTDVAGASVEESTEFFISSMRMWSPLSATVVFAPVSSRNSSSDVPVEHVIIDVFVEEMSSQSIKESILSYTSRFVRRSSHTSVANGSEPIIRLHNSDWPTRNKWISLICAFIK